MTSWRTLMACFVLSLNVEESLNNLQFLSPAPDDLRGGPSHGYNTSSVIKSIISEQYCLSYASVQSDRPTFNYLLSRSESSGELPTVLPIQYGLWN